MQNERTTGAIYSDSTSLSVRRDGFRSGNGLVSNGETKMGGCDVNPDEYPVNIPHDWDFRLTIITFCFTSILSGVVSFREFAIVKWIAC